MVESAAAAMRLREASAFAGGFDPGTEVLLVGASRGAVDDLARAIAFDRGAIFGLHRFSFTQLAARLAATALAARGLTPSTMLGAEAVAARATFEADRQQALGYFGPVCRTPGFPRALARTLQELRLAGLPADALRVLALGGPDLADLLDRFDAQFTAASASDRAALFCTAAAALRETATPWSGHPLLLLDVPIESAAEREFIAALVSVSRPVLGTVPLGDGPARTALVGLGGRIEALEEEERAESVDLPRLRRWLFSPEPPPARERSGDVRVFSAPGEGRECVEIARRILFEARAGTRFDEMAIFLRSPQSYIGLLEHALRRAGVPAWFDRGTRRPDPAGRAFLALLACAVEKLSARRFAEYLSLAQVPPMEDDPERGVRPAAPSQPGPRPRAVADRAWVAPTDEIFGALADRAPATDVGEDDDGPLDHGSPAAHGVPGAHGPGGAEHDHPETDDTAVVAGTLRAPWKWERLLVESAVIGGDEQRWVRRLDGLAAEYRLRLAELASEEPDSPRVARLERDRRNLDHLRDFALPIIETLAAWPASAAWGEWLDRFEALTPRVLRQPSRVLRVLADLRPMGVIGPVALEEVRDVLADRLLTLEAEPPARRYGRVFAGSPHQARGRAFRVVFVPGLAERMFPQKLREDPMLLDDLRRTLDAGLPVQDDRAHVERLLLRLAVGAATARLYLSYPRIEVTESRSRVPSFYALDVVRAVTGAIPNHQDLQREAADEGEASLAWPAPPDPDLAIDDLEHDLAVLRPMLDTRDRQAVRGRAHYLLALNDCLRRSVIARWARGRQQWSAADGLVRVTDATRPALAAQRLGARPYSLSALQRFATCPYQFLLAAVHRLEPAEWPEPLQRMDALTRGSLFHRIQADFFRALERAGGLPVTDANRESALAVLDQTIDRVAGEYRELLAPAIERVWRDEIAAIRTDLRVWANRLARPDGWVPAYFEFAFGLPGRRDGADPGDPRDPRSRPDPVVIGGRFVLRGSVDLVERREADGALRVTDHKTGKNRSRAGLVIGGGSVLQPVLYGLAVETALGQPVVSGRLYFCTSAGGFGEREIPLNDANRRLGLEALEIVDRAVEIGFLAPAPAEKACRWCDFRPVCGPHEERRIRRKFHDRLGDLEELRKRQ